MELKAGIVGSGACTVTEANTAKTMGSGTLDVFATPAMVALMEQTAWQSVAEALPAGSATVGTRMDIRHISATPLGMEVTCQTRLTAVEGRKLTFTVQCSDGAGLIGEGTHDRFVVDAERFAQKAQQKK